jgi:LssY C-terminus
MIAAVEGERFVNAHLPEPASYQSTSRHRLWRGSRSLAVLLLVYLGLAYLLLPVWWRRHNRHPGLAEAPKTTQTSEGIPGDPLNVALIGSREQVVGALLAAGWYPADPVTFRSSLHITTSVLSGRPYLDAPMSNLYLWHRRQDLSFERPVGRSPRQRHHVRFWRAPELDEKGRPLWLGAATFDRSVGFSHRTGQVTHHIAADVDAERDQLFSDLESVAGLQDEYRVRGLGPTRLGRNGGGDPYYTDGDIRVGVLAGAAFLPRDE